MTTNIYVKYHSYDKNTDSLIVSFASDETASQNPDDYNPVVVQPALQFPGITEQEELEKQIAIMGAGITNRQKLLEDCHNEKLNVKLCESLIQKGLANYNLDS